MIMSQELKKEKNKQPLTAVQIQCGVLVVCRLFTTFNFINGGY
jgi:hypothetical protein